MVFQNRRVEIEGKLASKDQTQSADLFEFEILHKKRSILG
jgi:hypothetical protein